MNPACVPKKGESSSLITSGYYSVSFAFREICRYTVLMTIALPTFPCTDDRPPRPVNLAIALGCSGKRKGKEDATGESSPRAVPENNDIFMQSSTRTGDRSQVVDNVELVDDSELGSLNAKPRLSSYLSKLWGRRHFILADAKSKSLNTGRGTFLGKAWILINPMLQVAVFVLVFGLVLKVDRGIDNFVGFLIIGVIFFGFLSGGLSAGSGLIQAQRSMISSFQFPRAALTFSVTLRNAIDNIAPAIVAVVLAVLTQLDRPIHWTIILVVPLFVIMQIFALGCTLWISRITAFIPDTKALVSLAQRALFFLSGVFFPLSRFDAHPVLKSVMEANPIYQFLTAVRMSVLDGVIPPLGMWIYLLSWSAILSVTGLIYFWMAEGRYSRVR